MSYVTNLQKGVYNVAGKVYATWLPNDPVEIGDVGKIAGGRFVREFQLSNKGFSFRPSEHLSQGSMKYENGVKVDVRANVDGQGMPGEGLSSSVSIQFGAEGSFVYHVAETTYHRFPDRQEVFGWVFARILSGELKWQDSYVLIDEVRVPERASLIVSDSSGARVDFDCSIDPGDDGFLAKLGGEVEASIQAKQIFRFLGLKKPHLFFHPVELVFDPGDGPGPTSALLAWVADKLGFQRTPTPEQVRMVDYAETDGQPSAVFQIDDVGEIEMTVKRIELEDFLSRELEADQAGLADDEDIFVEQAHVEAAKVRYRTM